MKLILTVVAILTLTAVTYSEEPTVDVETILDQLESRGAAIEDIRCSVEFQDEDRITEDVTKRFGSILFKRKKPNPIFLIEFRKTVQDGRPNRKRIWYRFDGRYLYEALERSKSIIKRDYAPPGTEIDLFDMENAPFPIPFGQKKEEILRHFDVTIGPGNKNAPADTHHLICVPKPEDRFAKDYTKVQFFVSKKLRLPVRIVMTANPPNKEMTADFPDLSEESINNGLPDSAFELPRETKSYPTAKE